MKSFLKYLLATIFGLLFFFIIATIIFVSMVGVAMGSDSSFKLEDNSVLEIDMEGVLVERIEYGILNSLNMEFYSMAKQVSLQEVLKAIDLASQKDEIKGIVLNTDKMVASLASLQEIYNSLEKFKASGKFIIAYSDMYGNGSYFLSSLADKVYMNNQGLLAVTGLNATAMFYKDLFDKIGVKWEVFKVGTFKSAVEPYIQNHMSDANRMQLEAFTSSVWKEISSHIAANRNISEDVINDYINSGAFFSAQQEAVEKHLVDSLIYRNDIDSILKVRVDKEYNTVSVKDIVKIKNKEKTTRNKVAVVYAVGGIDTDNTNSGINSEKLTENLLELAKDDEVKAIVLRVNSPGGSAFGSEQIWNATKVIKEHNKPFVVSMGNYAASGGYYISCAADRIFAQPTTLTGSIGIFGLFPNMEKLFDKVGLTTETVKTHKFSDFGQVDRKMTVEEKAIMQAYIERGYDIFTKRCADGRGVSQDDIKEIAEGRIYSGVDALKLNLVDELGGLDMAIKYAVQKAKLDNYKIIYTPTTKSIFEQLTGAFNGSLQNKFAKYFLGEEYEIYNAIREAKNMKGIQAIMPYTLVVK